MNEAITIRPARPDDAERAATLLYSAYRHTKVTYPLREQDAKPFLERLGRFFRKDGNRFSYECIQVAELQSEVVGLVLSFGGREEELLNAATGWRLEREAQDDEWYVDGLAVFTNWGHRGIGTRLLQAAEQQARQHGYSKVALNVAKENEHALIFYQHRHYVITQQTFLYYGAHVRLVKNLERDR